jgi:hypothetical protein
MTCRLLGPAIVLALAFAGGAHAAVCGGAPPADATEFRGPVLDVLDGEHLCVALGPDPSAWVPVRIADVLQKASTTPPSRGALMAASFGQDVTCRITGRDDDGVVAECSSDRGPIGRLAGGAKAIEAGYAWR